MSAITSLASVQYSDNIILRHDVVSIFCTQRILPFHMSIQSNTYDILVDQTKMRYVLRYLEGGFHSWFTIGTADSIQKWRRRHWRFMIPFYDIRSQWIVPFPLLMLLKSSHVIYVHVIQVDTAVEIQSCSE